MKLQWWASEGARRYRRKATVTERLIEIFIALLVLAVTIALVISFSGCGSEASNDTFRDASNGPGDAGYSDVEVVGDASGAFELCERYRDRFTAYAAGCGADGPSAATAEIERVVGVGRGCASVIGVDQAALGECVAALESILTTCTTPEDFQNGVKMGPCYAVSWTVTP